jgi:hypothetical protein
MIDLKDFRVVLWLEYTGLKIIKLLLDFYIPLFQFKLSTMVYEDGKFWRFPMFEKSEKRG